ncbi:hypothetical protein SAMN04487965_0364 [Microbulbifer donghaiensis]|uniref:Uncharacterized protein n=1 Tax=Microbulbifer donghaiensis TaxID=494016 RepID=A0A1M4V9S8_9GAMM|nr:hypothetical protein [Microbulbifer donghaiensis]SHE65637.1 hypothetical protein SAMN04487965_0364 [Microbulbifer donghaiensis]
MKLAILISAVLVTLNVSAKPVEKSSIVYESLRTYWLEERGEISETLLKTERVVFNPQERTVGINNVKYDYQVLDSQKWRGITSLGFNFVIPRDWSPKEGLSWEYEGLAFVNKELKDLNLLGRRIGVTPIEVTNISSKSAFGTPAIVLYSKEIGVAGIVIFTYDPEGPRYVESTYLLANGQGFRF